MRWLRQRGGGLWAGQQAHQRSGGVGGAGSAGGGGGGSSGATPIPGGAQTVGTGAAAPRLSSRAGPALAASLGGALAAARTAAGSAALSAAAVAGAPAQVCVCVGCAGHARTYNHK
jgi:hypothetical protein